MPRLKNIKSVSHLQREAQINEDKIQIHRDMRVLQSRLVWATFFLTFGTIVMGLGTIYQAYQTQKLVELAYYQTEPKVDIMISSSKMPIISGYMANYIELSRNENTSMKDFQVPLKIDISNTGPVPVMIKSIKYSFSCGKNEDTEIPFKRDISQIKPLVDASISEKILVHYITIPSDEGNCKLTLNFNFNSFSKEEIMQVKLK